MPSACYKDSWCNIAMAASGIRRVYSVRDAPGLYPFEGGTPLVFEKSKVDSG